MYTNQNRRNQLGSTTRDNIIWKDLLVPVGEKIKPSLADKAFHILREAIVTGDIRPNQRMVEYEIAQKLGMSRTPVREAIGRLEEQGYLQRISGHNLIVADYSSIEIGNLFEVRESLETMALRLACQRATDEQLDKVEKYHLQSLKAVPDENQDPKQFIELNFSFHSELYITCGNELLLRLIKTYGMDQFLYTRLTRTFTPEDWRRIAMQHGQILEAVRQRNIDLVDKTIREHIQTSRRIALQRLS
jgi:DNA-binding GntR family transcriptional regulator